MSAKTYCFVGLPLHGASTATSHAKEGDGAGRAYQARKRKHKEPAGPQAKG